jgi:hypothetical protein
MPHPAIRCTICRRRPRAPGRTRCRTCLTALYSDAATLTWKRRRTRLRTMPDGPLVGTVDMAAIFANLDRAEAKALAAAAAIINKKGPAG